MARIDKERARFAAKLAQLDARIAALVDPPEKKARRKPRRKKHEQLSLIS